MAENTEATLTVEGKEYKIADLPEKAKAELNALQFAESEIQRLQMQLAVATTARNAYRQALVTLVQEQ